LTWVTFELRWRMIDKMSVPPVWDQEKEYAKMKNSHNFSRVALITRGLIEIKISLDGTDTRAHLKTENIHRVYVHFTLD
jgi:hypothetical protein